jgi:hypothetical protein
MDETALLQPLPHFYDLGWDRDSKEITINGETHKLELGDLSTFVTPDSHPISAIVSSKQLKALCSFTMLSPKCRSTTPKLSTPRFEGKEDQVDWWSLWGVNSMMLTSGKLSRPPAVNWQST